MNGTRIEVLVEPPMALALVETDVGLSAAERAEVAAAFRALEAARLPTSYQRTVAVELAERRQSFRRRSG